MFHKLALYINTVKYMKPSQIYYRVRKMIGLKCTIGCIPSERYENVQKIGTPKELDFDEVFLKRFNVDEILDDRVTFLHSSRKFDWNSKWELSEETPLWNFNLHYFEFLFPLFKVYKDTKQKKYLDKTKYCIQSWIKQNLKGKGIGWASYTLALRLTNWISYYTYIEDELDQEFQNLMLKSMHEQYQYLAVHAEKDLLGNHYFEDLKTLILCAIFFDDKKMLEKTLPIFKKECKEEILADGMHFELSPMYHKIIFEDILRVAVALRSIKRKDTEIEEYLQPMLNVAWSLEEGLERIPLFNDSGNNVAKSLQALVETCGTFFNIYPQFKSKFEKSGFYILKRGKWKLIVDAGQPGPKYIPGHAHCDAMSYELFREGKPIIVNCGTYAYQCKERAFFRSTAAHNTVMVNNIEQSQCWGAFRVAKRSYTKVLNITDFSIDMVMVDQNKQKIQRTIVLANNTLNIIDKAVGYQITSYIHMAEFIEHCHNANEEIKYQPYAVDYGEHISIAVKELTGQNVITIKYILEE